jgi:hypothetical protein
MRFRQPSLGLFRSQSFRHLQILKFAAPAALDYSDLCVSAVIYAGSLLPDIACSAQTLQICRVVQPCLRQWQNMVPLKQITTAALKAEIP